jgi:hypothetical protein
MWPRLREHTEWIFLASALLGATIALLGARTAVVREGIFIFLSSFGVAVFGTPAFCQYFNIESPEMISALTFIFACTGNYIVIKIMAAIHQVDLLEYLDKVLKK